MRTRVLLVVAGFAAMTYGGWLLRDQLSGSLLTWLLAGPVGHDLLLAPVVAVGGLLLARLLPRPWRGAAATGLVVTAVLLALAVPLVARPSAAPTNPGLQDRASLPQLTLLLAAVWTALLGGVSVRVALRAAIRATTRPAPRPTSHLRRRRPRTRPAR